MNHHPYHHSANQPTPFFMHPAGDNSPHQAGISQQDVMAIVSEATQYLCQVINQYSQHLRPQATDPMAAQPPKTTELHFTFPAPPPMVQRVVISGPTDEPVPPFVMVPVCAPPIQQYELN
ncbi:MAG: hypothetical protein KC474_04960 [Cyanobacteria bacterium HKST-UBA04]|nr:hypothetical protein [Cyanobacteria bacterium HKST-UBA04]MCA9842892.1 hypothetical protein [Cyanobacteria bacterium HKST-UBA03]